MQGAFCRVAEYVCGGGAPVLPVVDVGHVLVCDRVSVVFDDDSCPLFCFLFGEQLPYAVGCLSGLLEPDQEPIYVRDAVCGVAVDSTRWF